MNLTQIVFFGLTSILACTSCSGESGTPAVLKAENHLETMKGDSQPTDDEPQKTVSVNFTRSAGFPAKSSRLTAFKPGSGVNNTSLEKLKQMVRAKPQEFVISAENDTMIVGKSGTRVHISAASFTDATGKNIAGEIVFSLIECYSPLEMFAHNLSTMTTDGKLIETGGSVFVDAKQAGQQLELKPGKKVQIDFPKGETDLPGMQEFKGVANKAGIVEWNSIPSDRGISKKEVFSDTRSNGVLNVSGTAPWIYLIEMKKLVDEKDLSSLKFADEKGTLEDWLGMQALKDGRLKERFNNRYKVELKMSFDKKGKISEIKSTRLVEQTTLDELYRFFSKAPALDMSAIRPKKFYPVILKGRVLTNGKELKEYYTRNNLEWKPDFDVSISKTGDYYTLNVGWIGWVNCDRFVNDSRQKVEMALNVDKQTSVFMIFSNIASQISPSRLDNTVLFKAIPLGEPIRLIALRIEDDEYFMEKIDTKVTSGLMKLNPSSKVSKEEFLSAFEL